MSTPPIDSPVAPFEVTCQIGQFVMDSDDPDRAPDLIPVGGTVTIEPDLNRPIRISDAAGTRVVGVGPLEFTIDPGTGKLIHPDGGPGVELINPNDAHLDPRGWTYTARVQPAEGRPWITTFGAPADGSAVDLGSIAPVEPSPGITANYAQQTIEARDQAESFAVRAETAATEAEGWAPSFVWDGTALSIDGGTPVDLKGEKGDGSSWAELTGKPDTYPPAQHEHETKSTGVLDVTALSPEVERVGSQGGLLISRVGNLVEVTLYAVRFPFEGSTSPSFNHFSWRLPSGFTPLPGTLKMVPVIQGNSAVRFRVVSSGQLTVYGHDGANGLFGSVTFSTTDPWPTDLPGDPA